MVVQAFRESTVDVESSISDRGPSPFASHTSSEEDVQTGHAGATPSAAAYRDSRFSVLFLGDIMLDRTVRRRINNSKDPYYPFRKLESSGGFFRGQDLVVGNLECPLSSAYLAPEKEIDFACDPAFAPVLKDVGIDALSQANNHALDQGRKALETSKRLISDAGIAVFGDQVQDDEKSAMTVVRHEKGGVALLGWNTTDNELDRDESLLALMTATTTADYVIVFMHWGSEYRVRPNASEVELAHWFIDQGADAVIGSHPHWMQSVEVYQNKPIVYSLGNFIFDQDWSHETQNGLAVKLMFGDEYNELELWPVAIPASQPYFQTGAARQTRLDRLADISDPGIQDGIRRGVIRMMAE